VVQQIHVSSMLQKQFETRHAGAKNRMHQRGATLDISGIGVRAVVEQLVCVIGFASPPSDH
jgi:hypothetical protein